MKLAIIYCSYDLPRYIHKSLNPWFNLKQELGIGIFAVHGLFKENFENGVKDEDFETQQELLKLRFEDKIDWLYLQNNYDAPSVARKYETEAQIRDHACQKILEVGGYSHLMILDGDEIYTEEEIRNIHKFVDDNKFIAWFSIPMRNMTFGPTTYTVGFCPPRVFSLSSNGFRLKKIFYDNDAIYTSKNDESAIDYRLLASERIPEKLVFVTHYCWDNYERSCEKIRYQLARWSPPKGNGCSFKINEKEKKIEWDLDYFKRVGQRVPELFSL